MPEMLLERTHIERTERSPNYRVVVIKGVDDDVEHMRKCLRKWIPGMTEDKARNLTRKVQDAGVAVVWVGPRKDARSYHDCLRAEELTVTLESDAR